MRVLPPRLLAFLVVAAFGVGACTDSTAPADPALRAFAGTFVLQSVRDAWRGTYAVRGDTVDFAVQCPPGALCVRSPVAWRTADGSLVIAYPSTQGFQAVSRFARVR